MNNLRSMMMPLILKELLTDGTTKFQPLIIPMPMTTNSILVLAIILKLYGEKLLKLVVEQVSIEGVNFSRNLWSAIMEKVGIYSVQVCTKQVTPVQNVLEIPSVPNNIQDCANLMELLGNCLS
jgi:hypothetical protein